MGVSIGKCPTLGEKSKRLVTMSAVRAFDWFADKSVHSISVQSKLCDWSETVIESAASLQAAIDAGLLVMHQSGVVSKP